MMDSSGAALVLEQAIAICGVPAPTFAEAERAAFVEGLLRGLSDDVWRDEAGNVLCAIGGRGEPFTVFAGHLDTVFPASQAIEVRRDPATARVYAPGIGDNSLGVAALLHLARRFAGAPVRQPLLLAATVGEEGLGDLRGSKHLVATVPIAAFVAVEGLMLSSIKRGGIGSTRYRVTYRGPGGHPWGDRGAVSAVHALLVQTTAVVEALAPLDMVTNFGRIAGGTSINSIASEAEAELDLRAADSAVLEEGARRAVAILEQVPVGLEATVELLGQRPGGSLSSDHPLLDAARRARAAAGLAPAAEGLSSTDANAAYARDIPAIAVGVTTGGNTHRPDEYIDIGPIAQGLEWIERLVESLVA